jgi:3-methyl-2-oxobutanoate hydroxymethyltransferase
MSKVTIQQLQQMKRDGQKIAGVVAWDTPMAKIADKAGVDLVSVGDSVGVNLWGHETPLEVTMDEMLVVSKAVRRGVTRALVSCDLPYGPAQESPEAAFNAAARLM